ncbi:MAG: hemerythrin domain-containing protein [Chloroflexi bacterium]|nr:hemerythrin domain-containing protein [Chloroflexota bacterium]
MENWEAMRILKAAHEVGLAMLDSLAQAATALREERRSEALRGFERVLHFFDGELKIHFDHEERALFPALSRIIGPAGPVGAMIGEHDSLWRCVDDFTEEIEVLRDDVAGAEQRTIAEIDRLANHIIWLLRGHINKEDTMLFPLAEKTLDERTKREVVENMALVERLAKQG